MEVILRSVMKEEKGVTIFDETLKLLIEVHFGKDSKQMRLFEEAKTRNSPETLHELMDMCHNMARRY